MTASDFVHLRSGLIIPLEPVALAFDLENRGIQFSVDGDLLVVRPKGALTNAERAAVIRWKRHLVAMLHEGDYVV